MSGDVGAEAAAVLAASIAEALFLRVMDATTDSWTEWRFASALVREPYEDEARQIADALAPLIAARVEAAKAEALLPFEELFDGGPDTACRTVWRQNDGMGHGEVEYVEVPMDDLRDAFARAAALDPRARP